MPRLTAFVSGMVQKTGYRSRVVILANAFGLSGYVQNLRSGKVKIVAEGDKTDLTRFLNCLTIRDALIDVQSIENEISAGTDEFTGFEKMVSSGETDQRLDRAADLLKDLIVVTKDVVVELKSTHEEIRGIRDEVKGAREDIKGVRDEVKAAREDIKGVNVAVQNVCQAVNNIGNALSEKIDCAKDEIVNEVKGLRSDLRGDLKGRLVRMDADLSQIKTKCGL
ncbi:MAG: acylphosphatase [Methanothrix sp.]|nr:acylphosphatase [Methanothrix sp.]